MVQGIKSSLIKLAGHVAHMGKRRGPYRVLVWRPDGKRPLGRRRRRWEDNVKIDLQEVGRTAWTGLIWLRIGTVAGACECGNEPSCSIKCGEFLD
jgi:hypothetical protein